MQKCTGVCRLFAKNDCAGRATWSAALPSVALGRMQDKPSRRCGSNDASPALSCLHRMWSPPPGWRPLVTSLPVSDQAIQQGAGQPPAASTFGGIRRTGIAQQVEPGSRLGAGTGTGQASKTGSAPASTLSPPSHEKNPLARSTQRRVTIPAPRPFSPSVARSQAQPQPGREASQGAGSTWRQRPDSKSAPGRRAQTPYRLRGRCSMTPWWAVMRSPCRLRSTARSRATPIW